MYPTATDKEGTIERCTSFPGAPLISAKEIIIIYIIKCGMNFYSFLNVNGATVELWEMIINIIPIVMEIWLLIHAGIEYNT